MPVSKKQLQANRQNAQHSTGPTTEQGKAASSRNAHKHGMYSKDIILSSPHCKENPNDYQYLIQSLFEELHPETVFQEYLVTKIANCLWRSRRAIRAETAKVNSQLCNFNFDYHMNVFMEQLPEEVESIEEHELYTKAFDQIIFNETGIILLPYRDYSVQILRYEMRLDRQMTRAYRLLKQLQKTTKTETAEEEKREPLKNEETNPFPCNAE